MDPLDFWRRNDAPDRQGITENLHVQGYLAYWDELRRRHPDLLIDSCASGGRRNDLETMRRAVPLHPTDYNYWHLAAKQAFHHSLFQWIPYFGSNTVPIDHGRSLRDPQRPALSVVLGYDMRRNDLDYALLRKLTEEVARVAPLLLRRLLSADAVQSLPKKPGSPGSSTGRRRARGWSRPSAGPAARRPPLLEAPWPRRAGGLRAEEPGSGGHDTIPGRDLMEKGLPVALAHRPQAAVITYRARQRPGSRHLDFSVAVRGLGTGCLFRCRLFRPGRRNHRLSVGLR